MKKILYFCLLIFVTNTVFAQFSSDEYFTEDSESTFNSKKYLNHIQADMNIIENTLDWNIKSIKDNLKAHSRLTGIGFSLNYKRTFSPNFNLVNIFSFTFFEKTSSFYWSSWEETTKRSNIPKTFNNHLFYELMLQLQKYNLDIGANFSYEDLNLGNRIDLQGNAITLKAIYKYDLKYIPITIGIAKGILSDGYLKNSNYIANLLEPTCDTKLTLGVEKELTEGKIIFLYNFKKLHKDIYSNGNINNFDLTYLIDLNNTNIDFGLNIGYNFSADLENHNTHLPKYYYNFTIKNNFLNNKIIVGLDYRNKILSRSTKDDYSLDSAILKKINPILHQEQSKIYNLFRKEKQDFNNSILKLTFAYLF